MKKTKTKVKPTIKLNIEARKDKGPWTFSDLVSIIPPPWNNLPLAIADPATNEAQSVMRVGFHYDTNGKCRILLYRTPLPA